MIGRFFTHSVASKAAVLSSAVVMSAPSPRCA
jgi:hypothetical protein